MEDTFNTRYQLLFQDAHFAEALSSIGLFATYYPTGESIASDLWLAQGYEPEEIGKDLQWTERVHPDDRERIAAAADAVFRGERVSYEEVFRMRRADGSYRWVVTRGKTITTDEAGRPVLFVGVDTDVSRFKAVEARLQQQNDELETLRQVAAVIGSSLDLRETVRRILKYTQRIIPYETATVQLLQDGELRVIGGFGFQDLNQVMKLRFPYPEAGSLSTEALDSKTPCMSLDVTSDFPAFVQPGGNDHIYSWIGIPLVRRGEVIGLMTADSTRRDAYDHSHLKLAATIADHIAIALENARLHDETYHMAMTDSLTQTGSRRRFEVEGRLLYENAQRSGHPVAALMVDIDHFKPINDAHGHDVGDLILRRVADACGRDLRGSDLLARYGGEEFVVVLPESSEVEARTAAERMRSRVEAVTHPELDTSVTVSIGVAAEIPHTASGFERLIHRADRALYRAKDSGRNRVAVADSPTSKSSPSPKSD
ncbi:MAG: diguanylate cyclase [Alkalispirochaeta sp.]